MQYDEQYYSVFWKIRSSFSRRGMWCLLWKEAEEFLEENFAVVVNSLREVWDFFEEEGIDMDGADEDEILNADEVFEIGDGRYLIIEG